ncbi:MAG: efflux RND transporter periplasmic adaptor subunit [Halieaceae bacterium]|jgi:multidrug efflux system membrane fusion protein|nr:efflux RND transporter periplasmic adaptor subunit [Halieaceae bacterium]
MKKNLISAGLVAAGLLLWLLSGLFVERPAPLADTSSSVLVEAEDRRFRVRVARFDAQQRTLTRVLRGKTETKRAATVSAETGGQVVARPVERGQRVSAGETICRLSVDDREAVVEQARADLQRAELEERGAMQLKENNLLSQIRIAQVGAELKSARVALRRAELDLARTDITAPFDGVVETFHLDVGDFASVGTPCATLVSLDPLLIVANVSERDIGYLSVGQPVTARTSTDDRLAGTVSFVGSVSDAATRTYPIEITVANPDFAYRAGLTTVVSVETATVLAHHVPPSLFTLDDEGVVGIRGVDRDNRVTFYPVEVVEDAADGAWVTGLPGIAHLITVGHEFVSAGELVDVLEEDAVPLAANDR